MSFDPSLPSLLDRIRLIVGDTSGPLDGAGDAEILPDETYLATIAEYDNWKLAAAAMAEAVAVRIEQDPTSVSFPADMSVGWSDRTRSLRATAVRLRSEAAAESQATTSGITSVTLTRDGGAGRSEYRDTRYRTLRR